MQKKIRAQTNEIFNKIQKSLNKQIVITDTTKLVDRHTESRYHTARK
jgi:hypothetical protein